MTNLIHANHNLSASNSTHIVRGYAEQIATQETCHLDYGLDKTSGKMLMASASVTDTRSVVDVSWLPAASEIYHISPNIKDYIIAEVPIVEGDVPNRNMNCFLTSRLVEFSPRHGCQIYRTFVGKPVFEEHDHEDNTKAKGVILDSSMRNINGRWFVVNLKAFDRTKDSRLATAVLNGSRRGHSMSAWANGMDCSNCGHHWDTSWENACDCVRGPRQYQMSGKFLGKGTVSGEVLIYDCVHDFYFFEDSSVGDPAAWSAHQMQQSQLG